VRDLARRVAVLYLEVVGDGREAEGEAAPAAEGGA
jgi:hypothetical protein